jgi:hypothetical protein
MPSAAWPGASYADWSETCDTLHAHTQVLGKIAAVLAPPEPNFQHLALRLTARGWETAPLPAPDGSGPCGLALDLRSHEALVEHSDGRARRIPLTPDRAVGEVTREVLAAVRELAGPVPFDPKPDEVHWEALLDEDTEHATYETEQVASYFAAAGRAAQVLAAFRAPHEGRSTPISAWWGSFDVAVSLFSDDTEVAVGWWPGDPLYPRAAFYAYASPPPESFAEARLAPDPARWDDGLGEFLLDWDDVRVAEDPHAAALEFARSALREASPPES